MSKSKREERQAHRKRRPLTLDAFKSDIAAVQLDTALHNEQSQPRAGNLFHIAAALKRLEQPLLVGLGNAAGVKRPYKVIPLLSRAAAPKNEGAVMNAIAWNARQLGADAIITLPPRGTGWRINQWGGGPGDPVFSAQAIVFTDAPKP